MRHLWYEPSLKQRAKELRNSSTLTEILLWEKLKKQQVNGYSFSRQVPIDHFIVDLYCKEIFLAIELDGSSHDHKQDYDGFRQERLNQLGIQILRFSNDMVLNQIDRVVERIRWWIEDLEG